MFDHLPPEVAKNLPTYPDYYKLGLVRDYQYWVEHEERLMEEWNAWMLK